MPKTRGVVSSDRECAGTGVSAHAIGVCQYSPVSDCGRSGSLDRDALFERSRHTGDVYSQSKRGTRWGGHSRRDRRCGQRQHGRFGRDRDPRRRARRSSDGPGLRCRVDGRHRSRERAVRDHGRRRRQLRLRRGAEVRGAAQTRVRPRARLPPRIRRRPRTAWCNAVPASLAWQPDVLRVGAQLVSCAHPRCLLRHARVHARFRQAARSTLHRDGVCNRDGHQGEPHRRRALPKYPLRCTPTAAERTLLI